MILLYHRVASGFDPLELNVSADHFAGHLQVITQHTTPCGLGDLVRGVQDRRSLRPLSAVTFDDGYRDNLFTAEPMLDRAGVPATVFVTPRALYGVDEMWWDEFARLIVEPAWTADPEASGYIECRRMLEDLRRTTSEERESILGGLRAREVTSRPLHPLLTVSEIVRLGSSEVVEIGAHTITHPVLSSLSEAEQFDEIVGGRNALAEILGVPPVTFAYPFGTPLDYNRRSVRSVARAGYALACANFTCKVGRASPRLELPRMLVRDWPAEEFERRLTDLLGTST